MAKTINLSVNELQTKFNRLGLKNKELVLKNLFGIDKNPQLTLVGQGALLIEPHLAETKPEVSLNVWVPGKLGPNSADWNKFLRECLEELRKAKLHASSDDVFVFTVTDKKGNTHTFIVVKKRNEE